MAVPAGELGHRLLQKHRRRREEKGRRRRRNESHGQHARRLRSLQEAHREAARHAGSSSERRAHEQAVTDIEGAAGAAEYAAAKERVGDLGAQPTEPAGEWQSALFLLVGSGLVLWLILSGHAKAVGEALGWLKLPKPKGKAKFANQDALIRAGAGGKK